MAKKLIYDGNGSRIYHDTDKYIIIKEVSTINIKNLRHYMEFQKTTPNVVKVLDILDDNTFTMECLNIICMASPMLSYHAISGPEFNGFDAWVKGKIHNPQFYNQKELEKIMDSSDVSNILKNFSKSNLFDLITTLNDVYSRSLEYSKNLPSNYVFHHTDFKLENIAVIRDKNNIRFKVIDPNSWEVLPGYSCVETYYHSQIHLAFVTQALLNKIFK